jgi:3'(2'), 5'-bisphosphate nucleotidase
MPQAQKSGRSELGQLVTALADLAADAGACILSIAAENRATRIKSDSSPVTAADEAAEALILEGLGRILPGMPVVAEEAAARGNLPRLHGSYLLVDPIDGTREFIAGRGEYTVNIALIEGHIPVLGVIYAPQPRLLFAGAAGAAWRSSIEPGAKFSQGNATPIRARPRPEHLTALVSRSHPDPVSEEFLARLPVERKIPLGSSLKFAHLAEGSADVYARLATINEWDIGAGHALLSAAGGTVTAPDGGPLLYGKREEGFLVDGFVAWGAPARN